jgi:hypothetical protein
MSDEGMCSFGMLDGAQSEETHNPEDLQPCFLCNVRNMATRG